MTTHKASFGNSGIQQDSTASEGTHEGITIENTSTGLAPSQEQMTAYLYGLLSEEESAQIEQRVAESASFKEALEASQQAQSLFAYWEDVPAPVGLADRVLQQLDLSERD